MGKITYGRPGTAEKCKYLDVRYLETKQPTFNNLEALIKYTIDSLGNGAIRRAGEINIPLFIWGTNQFQSWHNNLITAGNKLIDATLLQSFQIPQIGVFSFILSVNVWVEKEKRFKSNELIFSRKDISTVVAYYPTKKGNEILLLKNSEAR